MGGVLGFWWAETALIVVGLLLILLWFVWNTASHLDRMHRRVSASRMALDAQLVRRAGTAVDLAKSGLLDPASALVVADSAYAALDVGPLVTDPETALAMDGLGRAREAEESALSANLRHVLDAPLPGRGEATVADTLRQDRAGAQHLESLRAAWYRAELARRFHNEAVGQAVHARRHWWIRVLHLAGHAPMPQTVEFDDAMPLALRSVP